MNLKEEVKRIEERAADEISRVQAVARTLEHLPPEVLFLIRFACKVEKGTVRASIGEEHGGPYYRGRGMEVKECDRHRTGSEAFAILDAIVEAGWELLPIRTWEKDHTRHIEHRWETGFESVKPESVNGYAEGLYWSEVRGANGGVACLHPVFASPCNPVTGERLSPDNLRLTIALSVDPRMLRQVTYFAAPNYGAHDDRPPIRSTDVVMVPGAAGHKTASGDPKVPSNVAHVISDRARFIEFIERKPPQAGEGGVK